MALGIKSQVDLTLNYNPVLLLIRNSTISSLRICFLSSAELLQERLQCRHSNVLQTAESPSSDSVVAASKGSTISFIIALLSMAKTYPHKGHVIKPIQAGWLAVVSGESKRFRTINAAKQYIDRLDSSST